jgi:hypothetical protein
MQVEFIGNSAVGQSGKSEEGGAIAILGTNTTIKNCIFRDNTALRGGAISVGRFLEQSNVTLEEVIWGSLSVWVQRRDTWMKVTHFVAALHM